MEIRSEVPHVHATPHPTPKSKIHDLIQTFQFTIIHTFHSLKRLTVMLLRCFRLNQPKQQLLPALLTISKTNTIPVTPPKKNWPFLITTIALTVGITITIYAVKNFLMVPQDQSSDKDVPSPPVTEPSLPNPTNDPLRTTTRSRLSYLLASSSFTLSLIAHGCNNLPGVAREPFSDSPVTNTTLPADLNFSLAEDPSIVEPFVPPIEPPVDLDIPPIEPPVDLDITPTDEDALLDLAYAFFSNIKTLSSGLLAVVAVAAGNYAIQRLGSSDIGLMLYLKMSD